MAEAALPMRKTDRDRLPEIFAKLGVDVSPYRSLGGGETWLCTRGGASVYVSTVQPPHWAAACDVRRELVTVAVVGRTILKFWARGQENALRDDLLRAMAPLKWAAPQS